MKYRNVLEGEDSLEKRRGCWTDLTDAVRRFDWMDRELLDWPKPLAPGRGQGEGSLAESIVAHKFAHWYYDWISARDHVLGHEIDVIGVSTPSGDGITPYQPRVLAEVRDRQRPVTAEPVWKVIAMGLYAQCQPMVIYTSSSTAEAERVARDWGVILVHLDDVIGDLRMPYPPHVEYDAGPEILQLDDRYAVRGCGPSYVP